MKWLVCTVDPNELDVIKNNSPVLYKEIEKLYLTFILYRWKMDLGIIETYEIFEKNFEY
jgi:hypothetical protein